MSRYIPLLFSTLFIISCTGDVPPFPRIVFSELEQLDGDVKASELVSDYEFVPLDTIPDGIMLNYLTKVDYDDGIFFVREGQTQQGLFLFAENGRHLRHVLPAVEGANPFASIDDFSLDAENDRIYILSNRSRRIGVLNYELQLLDTIALDFAAYALASLDDRLFLASTNEPEVVSLLDLEGNILSKHFTDDIAQRLRQFMAFDKNEDFVLYHHWESDTVYTISPDGTVAPYYSLLIDRETPDGSSPIASFNRIGRHLIWSLKNRSTANALIFTDLDSEASVRVQKINNDISLNPGFVLPIVGKRGDSLITYMPSEYLLQKADGVPEAELNPALDQVLRRLEAASNPVLVLMRPAQKSN